MLGASYMPKPNVKYFAELVHAAGWVPLNFLSGGHMNPNNQQPDMPFLHESWSDQDATDQRDCIWCPGSVLNQIRKKQKAVNYHGFFLAEKQVISTAWFGTSIDA